MNGHEVDMNEHEFEPVRGLPELLPAGERTIWRGEPDWRSLARRVFHVRKIALYFGLLIAFSITSKLVGGESIAAVVSAASWQLTLALSALGILFFLAWLYARTTVYTLTSERLVMRFGVALTMAVNIPWTRIVKADLLLHGDGTGDIVFTVDPERRMSYILLWPLVRPWHFSPVMPAIRSIQDADAVAAQLGDVLRKRHQQPAVAATREPSTGAAPGILSGGSAPAPAP